MTLSLPQRAWAPPESPPSESPPSTLAPSGFAPPESPASAFAVPGSPPPDDATLIGESLSDPDRFAGLFDRHADEIHRYVARRLGDVTTADDVTAETFLVAFRKRGRYDPGRPDARPWLYGIASNLVSGHRRAETRRLRALARQAPERAAEFEERSAERVTAGRLRPALAAALARLGSAERDLLLLVAWADLSYEEAAQALGIPIGTVRSRLSRTRTKVRRLLESQS
ncbi:RNA polymerase sigma factor [Streptosporangium longisporum]|uniref:RNA polymerase sigma factor n=1 Tax=Streptosporangium longisporum TaxID=46187 RepID=UPI0039A4A0EB